MLLKILLTPPVPLETRGKNLETLLDGKDKKKKRSGEEGDISRVGGWREDEKRGVQLPDWRAGRIQYIRRGFSRLSPASTRSVCSAAP